VIKLAGIMIISVVVVVGVVSRFLFKKTDNIVEETAEKIIKAKTGIDIDLSPDTPEEKKDGEDK